MNTELLTRLVNLLRKDADNLEGVVFDLGSWATPTGSDGYSCWPTSEVPKVSCGTSACALGLAAISGEFKNEGLTCDLTKLRTETPSYILTPVHNNMWAMEAGVSLFDISPAESSYLFDPAYYGETPKGREGELFVAQRIEDMINGKYDDFYFDQAKDAYECSDDYANEEEYRSWGDTED